MANIPNFSIGWVLAVVALILCVVLYAVGRLPALEAVLIGLIAAARIC